ncbi:glycosyl transferase [Desulfoluna limicola]|uniref:Glycosyl transferase n=1 Tax=Desulfoluna limicola TaxID=2810562 RepID=A0ABN6F223_9BACT|nr:glycosyltransferase family 1 protein [Desulfoluna limicola]BCS96477.1 glycosyl transferase [Desulfoluna limicola]
MKQIGVLALGDKYGGGIYQYTQSFVDALKYDNTNNYIIFCNAHDTRFDHYGFEVRKINKLNSNFFKKIVRIFQFILFIRKPWFFSKKELENFEDIDIFISPVISAYPHFYMDKPFVFTLHDMQERYYPDFFSVIELSTRWLNNRTLSMCAARILCESNYVKSDIVKFTGVNENKISIIQSPPPEYFLNYKFINAQFEIVSQKYNLPNKYLFYPAQCWFHKNHIKLVEAFKKLTLKYDDIYLILSGSQQNNYDNLIRKIDELKLSEKVKHIGYVDYDDLPYIYKMSKMLVMPTLFESISIPIYEAFALKIPVCSSNVVALPEQVGNAGILFNPNSTNDIASKIELLLIDEAFAKDKAEIGFQKVTNYSHEHYKKKLLSVLNDL